MKKQTGKGLTILEALIVILASVILLWVIVPVFLVRYGYKDAGIMVVTEGNKMHLNTEDGVLRSRIKNVTKPILIDSGSAPKEIPTLPAKPSIRE